MDPLKIIYIEDNAANLNLVARVLEATGQYRVVGALDGQTGLEMIYREKPALVLVDLDVPDVNGFEIARRLKASSDPEIAGIPVAAVSANVMKDEEHAALEAGCCAFIAKPFELREFRREIARLTGRSPDQTR
ncbi:MAG: response regulator [Deltaproteobacteria bacterium]|nr:response regulator [Deltaproteobacteria bacterium]